ncbi:MAG TPA: hypothetical protein VD978_10145 [Azospirillum sp.]|nr:hypothetical protein [Azospirillum sp.]
MSTPEKRSVARDNTAAGNQQKHGTGPHARHAREQAAATSDNKMKGREGREAGLHNPDQEQPKGGDASGRLSSGRADR